MEICFSSQGECVLTLQLDDDDVCHAEEEEEVEFYLLFSGSTQRHVSSTLRVSHIILQAVCPGTTLCLTTTQALHPAVCASYIINV